MAELTLTAKQYLILMRSVAAGMVLDEHVSAIRGDQLDADLAEIWETLMDKAEDFGMSFPTEENKDSHWSDIMFSDADDSLHAIVDDEFYHLLSQHLSERDHAKTCPKAEGEHDEACFKDVQARAPEWMKKIDAGESAIDLA